MTSIRFRAVWLLGLITTGLWLLMSSCEKERLITDPGARLTLSADTIRFDTLFTTTGSVTRSFKISNPQRGRMRISQIRLAGGSASSFRMNVNGLPAVSLADQELEAGDSLYVFVTAYIQPGASGQPFLVSDSIQVICNGNLQQVQLEAYGQNAHFRTHEVIRGQVTWTDDLPHVILGSLTIDTGAVLTLAAGCRIYVRANTPWVVDGRLVADGEKDREVVFRGDRLDDYYRDLPGSWPGLFFRNGSTENRLRFAVIMNAINGIVLRQETPSVLPQLELHQSIIDHCSASGLFIGGASLRADNCLISNCGRNIRLVRGGTGSFTNCTIAAYSDRYLWHDEPVLSLSDAETVSGSTITGPLQAGFTNCIFWGDGGVVDQEVNATREGNEPYQVTLSHCLLRQSQPLPLITFDQCLVNEDPLFDSIQVQERYFDFRTTRNPLAPGLDRGAPVNEPRDLDDAPRTAGLLPDLGCYEKP